MDARVGAGLRRLARTAGLLALTLVFITPYVWMVGSAFKPRAELFAHMTPLSWQTFVPLSPTLQNFTELFTQYQFARPLLNSLFVALGAMVLSTAINSQIAYVLAWIEFPGRELLFVAILATLFVAFEAKLIPLYLITQRMGLHNTYLGLMVPWLADAYFIFLLRQHFRELSPELKEAALLDGCSYFRMYWNVMLPNIIPGLISAAFIKFIFTWDSYIWPVLVITDESMSVVTVALARLFSDEGVRWELLFAGSFVATVPVLIVFLFLQRYYVQGFLNSGIKG
ncbi:MAG TPA: sugar ABC transporter permease [Chloroflexi bacterium]|nr:sugar ABC transporter permease [Chloroflexota bacterium]